MTEHDEAVRQQRLLAALAGGTAVALREPVGRAERGLAAYRANAQAHAQRALAAIYPTVRAMLGEADFAQLAREHWRAAPPRCGDLGEWGHTLAQHIEAIDDLAQWPWLPDSARLEWALHCCERAADAVLDSASLAALAQADPAARRLVLAPGAALVESRYPIVAIHAAHRAGSAGFDAARQALSSGGGERAFVVRRGWRAELHALDDTSAGWVRALIEGRSLAQALAMAGSRFDFAAWLAQALRAGWLKDPQPMPDPPDRPVPR